MPSETQASEKIHYTNLLSFYALNLFTNMKYQNDSMIIKIYINKYMGGIFWSHLVSCCSLNPLNISTT